MGRVIDFASGSGVAAAGITFGEQRLVANLNGEFKATVPIGNYRMRVDGEQFEAVVFVRGPWTRGDFLARGGDCGSRYGSATDRRTLRPIAGAKVNGSAVTGSDGWYRSDYGCESCLPCNTAILSVSAPRYREFSRTLGRGVRDVQRLDIELDPQF